MENRLPSDRMAEALRRLYAIRELETLSHFWQGEPKILYHLYFRQDQEVNPSELSEALGVTRARITSILSSLRAKGLIRMHVSERDRRRMVVELSEQGRDKVEQECAQIEERMQRLRSGLGDEKARLLLLLLEQSVALLETGVAREETEPETIKTTGRKKKEDSEQCLNSGSRT
ncbi:MAG: MarR family winged helix-turn-helix transcriptional regulator [Firmicutes bacterium]|nr:MarR family winged helix-turn-helix transcriptional regulator [Bacillota bacterium]